MRNGLWWAELAGLAMLTAAAVFLWLGSQETPWRIRTWNGESDAERAFERRRHRFARWGLGLLALGFLLQIAVHIVKRWEP